jgi:hypothetical protein
LVRAFADSGNRQNDLLNVDWYIIPLLNPDGYEFSHDHDRMWRKNRAAPPAGDTFEAGLPDFSWYNILQRREKIYQMTTKCTKWLQNVPNGYKMYQMATKCTNRS